MTTTVGTAEPDKDREKQRVAFASVLAAVALTAAKLGVGLWTNSLGILSEALHSGLDLVAALITLWAVKAAARPADSDHPYGHGKFENLSALFETLLLFLTCAWIIYEAVQRLLAGGGEVEANAWAFAVVIFSIAVDYGRSRALMRAAKKYDSQALEADALHFSTDIWSSCVVLLGLAGVLAADRWDAEWLKRADAAAALGVALIVLGVSWRLGRKSVDDLLDAVPAETRARLAAAAAAVPGVESVRKVRARKSGPEIFADVTLAVGRTLTFEQAHAVADAAEAAIARALPQVDVTLHVEPVEEGREDATATVRLLAAERGLGVHGLRIFDDAGRRAMELHLEVDAALSVREAHRQASRFERALRAALPGLGRIDSHIEPVGETTVTPGDAPGAAGQVQRALRSFFTRERLCRKPHDVSVQEVDGRLAVTLHCEVPAETPITAAHDLTELMEAHLRRSVPRIGRVLIHVEPRKR